MEWSDVQPNLCELLVKVHELVTKLHKVIVNYCMCLPEIQQ